MNIENLLDQYGYWAVFCGVIIEGPITLTLAGFLAHQGYLNSAGVFVTAVTAVFLVIEMFYFIGMAAGHYLLKRWPAWGKYHSRFSALLERYKTLFLLGFRFCYGAHTLAPMAIGMARIHPAYFLAINAVGAVLWTLIYFLLGYFFGHAFELFIDDMKQYEKPISLVLVAAMLIVYLTHRLVWRRIAARKFITC
ncbi:MAG: DedA family protein [Kiritimatiellae bacterium]|nr:DedA family protein [Kiritimatiellia bacterium]